MKPLDKTKKYDLRKLSDEQLIVVLDWLLKNYTRWELVGLNSFKENSKKFSLIYDPVYTWLWGDFLNSTCTTELFETEKTELTLDDLHKDIKVLSDKYREQGFKIVLMFENL